jgi:hypothetical protein
VIDDVALATEAVYELVELENVGESVPEESANAESDSSLEGEERKVKPFHPPRGPIQS